MAAMAFDSYWWRAGALLLLMACGALWALWPEVPRWSGDGARAIGHDPLPPLAEQRLALSRGGGVLCQGDSNVRGKPRVAVPFCTEFGLATGLKAELRGHGGDTTAEGAERWRDQGTTPADLVILLYGTNDAAPRSWLGGHMPVPPDRYRDALAALAISHREHGALVLVLAPLPAGSPAMERRLQPYRAAARAAAAHSGSLFLDPAPAFAAPAAQPALRRDGLHLNQRGHRALGQWLARQVQVQ
jgi:lysophospholipase L1-like esterase